MIFVFDLHFLVVLCFLSVDLSPGVFLVVQIIRKVPHVPVIVSCLVEKAVSLPCSVTLSCFRVDLLVRSSH